MNAITQRFTDVKEQYKTLFDSSNDGIILHEPTGQILQINLKALKLFGYSEAEATQLSIQQLHPEDVMEACKSAFQTVMEQGETAFETRGNSL
ncbi:MAG: PAS domain-containing protein [Cyanobacteria bacterium J06642_11]